MNTKSFTGRKDSEKRRLIRTPIATRIASDYAFAQFPAETLPRKQLTLNLLTAWPMRLQTADRLTWTSCGGPESRQQTYYHFRNDNAPVLQISEELGFPNAPFICRYFKRETGMTPSKYRDSRIPVSW